ncbi:MAG: PH domain-containing protein [Anaerolineae bacterium]|nr:PH domain-containing protein [Anaerolineae bacterium]
MSSNDNIAIRYQTKRRPQFWFKAIFSLGIWLLWWRNDYLALTRRSVVRHEGVLNRRERAIPLNQVQDISISYGVIRRLLGHGDIRLETAGSTGTEVTMKNVHKPDEFRAQVLEQIDRFYDDDARRDAPEKPKEEPQEPKEG